MQNVRQIWRDELECGIDELRSLCDKFEYVSVSVIWPGFVARPITYYEYAYTTVKDTVNLSDMLQLGFSFADAHGRKPSATLQFNFVFQPSKSCIVEDCLDCLTNQGYDTHKAQTCGIDHAELGEFLLGSGVLMSENIKWITYHGAYDMAFLLKALTNTNLPDSKDEFISLLKEYFPTFYDVKYMLSRKMKKEELPSSLRQACNTLGLGALPIVTNPDASVRAGLNALLVSACFFNSLRQHFDNKVDEAKLNGFLYGLDDIEDTKLPPGMLRLRPGTYNVACNSNE